MLTARDYETKIRREIADASNPSISTVIDMLKTMRELERQVAFAHINTGGDTDK